MKKNILTIVLVLVGLALVNWGLKWYLRKEITESGAIQEIQQATEQNNSLIQNLALLNRQIMVLNADRARGIADTKERYRALRRSIYATCGTDSTQGILMLITCVFSDSQRDSINTEINKIQGEIDRVQLK